MAAGCSPSSTTKDTDGVAELDAFPLLSVAAVGENVYVGLRLRWSGAREGKVDVQATANADVVADLTGEFSLNGSSGNTEDSVLFRCSREGTAKVIATLDFDGGLAADSALIVCVAPKPDPPNDLFYSISSLPATFLAPYIDMLGFATKRVMLTAEQASQLSTLAEEPLPEDAPIVLQAANAEPLVEEEVAVVHTGFAAAIPRMDSGHSLTFGVVWESDAAAANDWKVQGNYDFDQYQGADLWYETRWDYMMSTWSVRATQVADDQSTSEVPTRARSFLYESRIVWVIPRTEIPSANPKYRVTSYGGDGTFSPADSGADVNGADPTQAMLTY